MRQKHWSKNIRSALLVCRTVPAPRCLSNELGADEAQIEASFCRGNQDREGTKVDFAGETRGSNLRGIPPAKKRVG